MSESYQKRKFMRLANYYGEIIQSCFPRTKNSEINLPCSKHLASFLVGKYFLRQKDENKALIRSYG